MTAISAMDQRHISRELTHDLPVMLVKVACIIFAVEAIIMLTLSGWDLNRHVINESLLDATSLTVFSTPMIYLWVARPFAEAARSARAELTQQLDQTKQLLDQNEKLRVALQVASENTAQTHEQVLQKIGAELHDGPAQLLGFTLLKLDRLTAPIKRAKDPKGIADLEQLRDVMGQTLKEVRDISTGLSLPELGAATIQETIGLAVRRHEEFTGSKVAVTMESLPGTVSLTQKICIYRFIQEALTNAVRHGKVRAARVVATGGHELTVRVADEGQGFNPFVAKTTGLGLTGMRARVQALGGRLDLQSVPGSGTTVTAIFAIKSPAATLRVAAS